MFKVGDTIGNKLFFPCKKCKENAREMICTIMYNHTKDFHQENYIYMTRIICTVCRHFENDQSKAYTYNELCDKLKLIISL
jgi:hypothetical protein